jgi:hypothetical protein
MGDCNNCGVHTLKLCPLELETTTIIHWWSIGFEVVGHNEDGRDRKVFKVEYHNTHPSELFAYLKPCLRAFLFHNFIFRW